MTQPLVSIIVTTRNNQATLDACLSSIIAQDYRRKELIVVDNYSTDNTRVIAERYTQLVFQKGPERSTQRNYAVQQARGKYVVIIDSDMELSSGVISACVQTMEGSSQLGGVIIPEESFGQGFWAQCKRLERSFYIGIDWIEAARFFDKQLYQQVGGYDTDLVSGEDWDLSNRLAALAPLGRINEFILHNEGRLRLFKTLQKKYYYAGQATAYLQKQAISSKWAAQVGPLQRYRLFFSRPTRLLRQPIISAGMLFMKTCEYAFGGLGYLMSKRHSSGAEATE